MQEVEKYSDDQAFIEHTKRLNKVAGEYIRGTTSVYTIAKKVGMKPAEVQEHLNEWKETIRHDGMAQDYARRSVELAEQHFNTLIEQAWDVAREAESNGTLRERTSALKLAHDIEKTKVEMLNKSGMADQDRIMQQIAESERKQEILTRILREVVVDCAHCKPRVFARLSEATGKVEEM